MICSEQLASEIEQQFLHTIPIIGIHSNDIIHNLSQCTQDQQILMKFLYSSMPFRDIADYDFYLYLEYVNHAIFLRQNVEWCKQIPERMFLNDVVFYRVNSENIMSCRKMFYDLIMPRIKGKSMKEAVLEINYWCAEHVTYQASDQRTESPLTAYYSGIGRCGEESTFVVAALRSVGIPARQVYTPFWAHCDDNHAWVEVWCDREWYFFGACEPDPVLNSGWFTNAASRALLIHSRNFANFKQDNTISTVGLLTYTNNTHLYAKTRTVEITVVDEDGLPIEGAKVEFQILNYSEYLTSATIETDSLGKVFINLGLGDILVHVSKNNIFTEKMLHTEETGELTICLKQQEKVLNHWVEYTVKAPREFLMHPVNITPEQAEENKNRVANCDILRNERIDNFYNSPLAELCPQGIEYLKAARGNFNEVYQFLTKDNNPLRIKLLKGLSQKDYRDLKSEILEEHILYSEPYKDTIEEEVFDKYILAPRIHYEMLSPYRAYITEHFTCEQKESFRKNPMDIWNYIQDNMRYVKEKDYSLLIISPPGALKYKMANKVSRKVLFVAICRTLGIPARLNPVTYIPEYYLNHMFVPVTKIKETAKNANLKLQIQDESKWIYNQNWSIAKLDVCDYKTLDLTDIQFEENQLNLPLESGEYRIITTNRQPTGDNRAAEYILQLQDGESAVVTLKRKDETEEHLLTDTELPDITLLDNTQTTVSVTEIAANAKNVFVWLEEGKEPTEHILNEMIGLSDTLNQSEIQINFIIRDKTAFNNKTLSHTLELIPKIKLYYDDFQAHISQVANQMKVTPDKLPLAVATNPGRKAVFASSGYNVGVVELILKILK